MKKLIPLILLTLILITGKAEAQTCVTATPTPTATPVMVCWTWTPTQTPTLTNTPTPTSTSTPTRTPTPTPTLPPAPQGVYYLDVYYGDDSNPGTFDQPWETMQKAFRSLHAGDTLYIRGGVYTTSWRSGRFENSGTADKPITVTNYPGEIVTIQVTDTRGVGWEPFMCWEGSTPKVDYVRIIGTNNGLVLKGATDENIKTSGIWGAGSCEHWEVAGVVFKDLKSAIFLRKYNEGIISRSPNNWHIHDNVVWGFYGESGFQIESNYALIEYNLIYKNYNIVNLPFGCSMILVPGRNNTIRNNRLFSNGSTAGCLGVLFEFDVADQNLVERNFIYVDGWGTRSIDFAGGDHNIVRFNHIVGEEPWYRIWDRTTGWPCNEPSILIPADDPRAPDYEYYYPHDCKATGNQIYDNVVTVTDRTTK